jgi:hypothetical protein
MMLDWRRWIGLPHKFKADPQDGEAADCLVMVWRILDEAGVRHPPLYSGWLVLAEECEWDLLRLIWNQITEPLPIPEEYAVCLFENGAAGLGVGIVVDNGVLIVHHKRGVAWIPLRAMKSTEFCRFK